MRRDSIFYKIFERSPEIVFTLIPQPPANTEGYKFESIEVKETAFRIDGVFVPPNPSGDIIFAEVQFQLDATLDERVLSESSLYIYRKSETFNDWRMVIIYPTRSMEQSSSKMPPELFASGRITRIYLDELGSIDQLPTGPALMVLTTKEGENAVTEAKGMLERSVESPERDAIINMVVTIMAYKFDTLKREEVTQMLGIELKDVRAFRESFEEGEEFGELKARREMLLELLQDELGSLSEKNQAAVEALSLDHLKQLSSARKSFETEKDLKTWLKSIKDK
jgi:predicted transposase/invertase (TIGR01784 family)